MTDFADLRSKGNVLSKDFEAVEKILRNLSTGGSQRLQVIVCLKFMLFLYDNLNEL